MPRSLWCRGPSPAARPPGQHKGHKGHKGTVLETNGSGTAGRGGVFWTKVHPQGAERPWFVIGNGRFAQQRRMGAVRMPQQRDGQPCLVYLHAVSLVVHGSRRAGMGLCGRHRGPHRVDPQPADRGDVAAAGAPAATKEMADPCLVCLRGVSLVARGPSHGGSMHDRLGASAYGVLRFAIGRSVC